MGGGVGWWSVGRAWWWHGAQHEAGRCRLWSRRVVQAVESCTAPWGEGGGQEGEAPAAPQAPCPVDRPAMQEPGAGRPGRTRKARPAAPRPTCPRPPRFAWRTGRTVQVPISDPSRLRVTTPKQLQRLIKDHSGGWGLGVGAGGAGAPATRRGGCWRSRAPPACVCRWQHGKWVRVDRGSVCAPGAAGVSHGTSAALTGTTAALPDTASPPANQPDGLSLPAPTSTCRRVLGRHPQVPHEGGAGLFPVSPRAPRLPAGLPACLPGGWRQVCRVGGPPAWLPQLVGTLYSVRGEGRRRRLEISCCRQYTALVIRRRPVAGLGLFETSGCVPLSACPPPLPAAGPTTTTTATCWGSWGPSPTSSSAPTWVGGGGRREDGV